jgi:hypothetical protein
MVNLPTIGTTKYNGYTFGVMTETVSIIGKPQWDSSGRAIKYIEWTLTLRTVIAQSTPTTTDDTLESLRKTLMAVGKPLQYEDKGFGPLTINVNDKKDVAWGPKPLSFNYTPIASRHAVEVVWSVAVAIPECDNAKYRGIMEAVFGVTYERDRLGHTKRTYNGRMTIATTRDGRRLVDTADNYLRKMVPEVPRYFRRISQTENVSEDKATITITIVDEELPSDNVPPEGIVEVSFEHNIASMQSGGKFGAFTRYTGRMTATYTVDRGKRLTLAVEHFAACVRDRALDLMKNIVKDNDNKTPGVKVVVPMASDFTEQNAYGVQSVKCGFRYLITCNPDVFMIRGMFRKMPLSDYDLWAKSMEWAWDARGHYQMNLPTVADAIVDLCLGDKIEQRLGGQKPKPAKPKPAQQALGARGWPYPPKESSFVDIQTSLTLEPTDSVMRHVPLESGEARLRTPALLRDDAFAKISALPRGSDPPIFQARAASMPVVIFTGFAIRAGWEIAPPVLRGAFGRAAIPANGDGYGFIHNQLPMAGPVPIFMAQWRLRYYLSDNPVNIEGGVNAKPLPQQGQAVGGPARFLDNNGFGGGAPPPRQVGIFGGGFVAGGGDDSSPYTFS